LLDIGVLPDIMTGNIIGVISQRLIRLLCPHCKKEKQPDEIESKLLDIEFESSKHKIFDAEGCSYCDNTGYKGRVAIIEALRINNELDEQIAKRATLGELKNTAKQTGYKTLADDAVRCVLEGRTSLTEVSRVIDLTQRLM
jgi:type II secretory ATPase GspE/PulE/Tfp pilus assembly ATPase PilB-like protein